MCDSEPVASATPDATTEVSALQAELSELTITLMTLLQTFKEKRHRLITLTSTVGEKRSDLWSPERNGIVIYDWPTYRPTSLILADVNEFNGPPVTWIQLLAHATRLRLHRPSDYNQVAQRRRCEEHKLKMQVASNAVPVSWHDAMRWGRTNRVPMGEDESEDLNLVNQKRVALKLPPFELRWD